MGQDKQEGGVHQRCEEHLEMLCHQQIIEVHMRSCLLSQALNNGMEMNRTNNLCTISKQVEGGCST